MSKFFLLLGLAIAVSLPSFGSAIIYEAYTDSNFNILIGEIELNYIIINEKNSYLIKEINIAAGANSSGNLLKKAEGISLEENPDSNLTNYIFTSGENLALGTKLKVILSNINTDPSTSKKLFIVHEQFEKTGSCLHFGSFYLKVNNNKPSYSPKT